MWKIQGRQRSLFQDTQKTETRITKKEWLDDARTVAEILIKEYGYCTSDMVKQSHPIPYYLPPSLIGNVFSSGQFKRAGIERGYMNHGGGRILWQWTF